MRKRKVFNDIATIATLFIRQERDEAMTPLTYIQGRGKGRRFYFRGNTCYSYRDSFPLVRIDGDIVYVKDFCPSLTTKKHKAVIVIVAESLNKNIIYSEDLKTAVCLDLRLKRNLDKLMRARKWASYYKIDIDMLLKDSIYPITKSKFPLLFNKKYEKVKQMLFSEDWETFNLARKIIKQQKLI